MRKEDLAFLDRAPVMHRFEVTVPAPRAAVFAAIADPTTWSRWFPGVRSARYASAPPHGVGAIREADVAGTRWVEEMIAWEPDRRWAYTVTSATSPVAWAQVESFEFADVASATRVRWTLAFAPRRLLWLTGWIAPLVMRRLFERAMRNLGTYLQESGAGEPAVAAVEGPVAFEDDRHGRRSATSDLDRWTTRLNPVMIWLLRSPLHPLLDGGLMLITVTGRRTGRRYTIPVGYQRQGDSVRVLVSKARRKQWWRNYLEPRPIELRLRGEARVGEARVIPSDSAPFRDVLDGTLRRLPVLGRQFGIDYDRRVGLTEAQWRTAAADAALVEIVLGPVSTPAQEPAIREPLGGRGAPGGPSVPPSSALR